MNRNNSFVRILCGFLVDFATKIFLTSFLVENYKSLVMIPLAHLRQKHHLEGISNRKFCFLALFSLFIVIERDLILSSKFKLTCHLSFFFSKLVLFISGNIWSVLFWWKGQDSELFRTITQYQTCREALEIFKRPLFRVKTRFCQNIHFMNCKSEGHATMNKGNDHVFMQKGFSFFCIIHKYESSEKQPLKCLQELRNTKNDIPCVSCHHNDSQDSMIHLLDTQCCLVIVSCLVIKEKKTVEIERTCPPVFPVLKG